MTNIIHVDFKKDREQKETLAKIKSENFNALTEAIGYNPELLEKLTIKPYALNKETKDELV